MEPEPKAASPGEETAPAAAPAEAPAIAAKTSRVLLCAQCFAPVAKGSDVLADKLPNSASVYAYNLDISLGSELEMFWCYQISMQSGNRADVLTIYTSCVANRVEADTTRPLVDPTKVLVAETTAAAAPGADDDKEVVVYEGDFPEFAASATEAARASTLADSDVWFEGYSHTVARCRTCRTQLGWLFEPVVPVQSATYSGMFPAGLEPPARPFAGLIVTKLKPQDADAPLSDEIDAYVTAPGRELLADELAVSAQLRMEMTMEDARTDIGDKSSRSLVGALLIGQLKRAMDDEAAPAEEQTPAERANKSAMDALRAFTIGLANRLADHDDDNDDDS